MLISELAGETRWSGFTPAALELGAGALSSFPLQIGAVRLGSLDCYRDRPGALSATQLSDALLLAELATQAIIAELEGHATDDVGWLANPYAEVHQATGMLQIQLDSTGEAALLRLRVHTYTYELPVTDVAQQVVARQLRFTPGPDDSEPEDSPGVPRVVRR